MNGANAGFRPSGFKQIEIDQIIYYKPFSIDTAGADIVPDLQYPDIYNYLFDFPSPYSGKSLKACVEEFFRGGS